jgi:light-regulated signal transduction histidine kinase (bacteriophytochrome)
MNNIRQAAEFCGRVPLNQTNLIQPHGILLVLDKKDGTVLQVSENVQQKFGIPPNALVGKSVSGFLAAGQMEIIQELAVKQPGSKITHAVSMVIDGKNAGAYTAQVHAKDAYLVMELEEDTADKNFNLISRYQDLKRMLAAVDAATTTGEACSIVAEELKKISGFDKVMIYRFDEAWNGEVIAEEMEQGMDPYYGLKFPATDIPKQARELYKKSPYRFIPNIAYEPVRLYPVINPVTSAFTDLSDSNLRSVAAVHLEYLANMNVTASMSTRILKGDKLWGLIACHHRTAKYLSNEMCSVFELLSGIISTKIASVTERDDYRYRYDMQQLQMRIIETIYSEGNILSSLSGKSDDLLRLLSADGVVIVQDRQSEKMGKVPPASGLEDLLYWLQSSGNGAVIQHPSLQAVYEPAGTYSGIASGILVLPVQPEKGNFILAFRTEAVQKVSWGGNPTEALQFESDGKKYHPRASFKIWQETVYKTAIPWKEEEIEVAEQFLGFVVNYTRNKIYN